MIVTPEELKSQTIQSLSLLSLYVSAALNYTQGHSRPRIHLDAVQVNADQSCRSNILFL